MADIAMCANNDCPLRNRCYRATAVASETYQNYVLFQFVTFNGETHCENFITRGKEKPPEGGSLQ